MSASFARAVGHEFAWQDLVVSRPEFAKQILSKQVSAWPEDKNLIGFHGTSLIAIEALLRTGVLPTRSGGSLFFYPAAESEIDPQNDAAGYARTIARSHSLMRALNIPIENEEGYHLARGLMSDFGQCPVLPVDFERYLSYDYLRDLSKFVGQRAVAIRTAVLAAGKSEGVLVGLAVTLESEFEFFLGDDTAAYKDKLRTEPYDRKIVTPAGCDLRHFIGVQPLGPLERQAFDEMRAISSKR